MNSAWLCQIRADEYAMLASCVQIDPNEPLCGLMGEIHKYTEISGDWENVVVRKPATDEDLQLIKIPQHLKPNRETFRYFLFPKEHRFVFQMSGPKRSISHNGALKLLTGLLFHETIKKKFPNISISINVEQEPKALEDIFKIPHLNRLFIHVERPNPDSISPADIKYVEELLAKQHADALDVTRVNAPGASLKLNEDNQRLARVASTSYGKVIAKGRDAHNRPVDIDTSEHPIRELVDYDKKAKASFVDQLLAHARTLMQRVMHRKQSPRHK